jgi:antitoxin component YwqK of YwqJK toxin-antitoxin module
MKKALLLFAALLVAGCGEKGENSLSNSRLENLLKESIDEDSLLRRNGLYYQVNESEPFSGWAKTTYDSGQVSDLGRFKNGKRDGLWTNWHENGQKYSEEIFKNGESDTYKLFNSKGEEVEALEEARK